MTSGTVVRPFEAALQRLRLEGAIFLRAEYREPWAYESLTGPATAAILRPGTDRVILFHVVASGTCWVAGGDGEKHWASAGDVIVPAVRRPAPHGRRRRERARPADARSCSRRPGPRMPLIRHGADGAQTDVVCGYLHSDDVLFDPALRVFPPVFVVRPQGTAGADWVRANIDFALAQADASPLGPDAINTRLPEMLLVEVLRQHLATAPAADRGWLAALHDPVLNPALAALHAAPERKWTVTDLARVAAVSRSGARRAVPAGARPLPDPLPHRVADAPGRGPAGLHRPRGRRDRPPGRVRRGGGVQPRVQARPRSLAERLAVEAPHALTSNPVEHASGSRVWTPASVSLDPWQARHASGSTYDWSSSSSG